MHSVSPATSIFGNGAGAFWLDEAAGRLKFAGKKSDGTVVTCDIGALV